MDKSIVPEIKRAVLDRIDPMKDTDEEELASIIDGILAEYGMLYCISAGVKAEYRKLLFNDIRKLDILQELLEDDGITEIMVNSWDRIYYERDGRIYRWDKSFESVERLKEIVQRIAALSNKIINESVPVADTRLSDGSRVNVVMNPIAIEGPVITIRKFYDTPISIEKLIEMGSITEEAADFLKKLVTAKYNIFVSGGTGSGKTTFLNALSNFIPEDERVITIEDSAELKLQKVQNLVRLEARSANIEGNNAVGIRDLIKTSLRMRPDRIIVGEVRGPEAIDMLQAMNSGHDGSMSTGHANGDRDMMLRLETMIMMGIDMPISAIRGQIASAIDIVVHLGRLRDKSRRVLSISEVVGVCDGEVNLRRLFEFVEEWEDDEGKIQGELKRTGEIFCNTEKLRRAGFFV